MLGVSCAEEATKPGSRKAENDSECDIDRTVAKFPRLASLESLSMVSSVSGSSSALTSSTMSGLSVKDSEISRVASQLGQLKSSAASSKSPSSAPSPSGSFLSAMGLAKSETTTLASLRDVRSPAASPASSEASMFQGAAANSGKLLPTAAPRTASKVVAGHST